MFGWIVASIALAILFVWMAATIYDAPLGIQYEHGFRVTEPSRSPPGWMRLHQGDNPALTPSRALAGAYGILLSPM